MGRSGSAVRGSSDGPLTAKVYLAQKNSEDDKGKITLKPVTIKTGVSDGTNTEVVEGLNEGNVVVSGLNLPAGTPSATTMRPGSSPFGGPFGGGGMRPR